MATRMQQRRGTASQWTSANPVLNAGEMGWESDTNKFKIGDGTNHWADLDYFADTNSTVVPTFGTSIVFEGATADSYETTLQATDPTADRTITLPNSSGTVVLADGSGNVTVSGNLTVQGTTTTVDSATINVVNSFTFEGSTADGFETILTVQDPTGDRTITLPDAAGTVILDTATQTLTNKTLTSPQVSNLIITDGSIVLEGVTPNDFETTLQVVDPTADRSITFPDATGTLILDAATQTLTNKTLTTPTITNPIITGAVFNDGSVIFEGTTSNDFETTLSVGDPTADRIITLPDTTGTVITTGNVSDLTFVSNIIFEGATADSNETTLAITDPTADRTITLPDASGTVITTGNLSDITSLGVVSSIVFEGSTADDFELTLAGGDPTADRTVSFPDAGGVVVVDSATQTLTNKTLTSPNVSNLIITDGSIVLEGSSPNDFETTLTVTDPTADRTISFPDVTGTVVTTGDTGSVTSTMIADGTIVNADINASAAIDKTKISGTAITAADSGTVTSAMIADGTIVNDDISTSAAIAATKISGTAVTQADTGTVTSTMIADGTIVNADINASAAIALSKLATDPLARANHTGTQTASTISDFDTQVRTSKVTDLTAPTGSFSMNSQKITSLGTPTSDTDAATKAYVDAATAGLNVHAAVQAATTANVTLASALENGDTLDGVTLATGNRVLVKNQTDKTENGIYVVKASGAPDRATDYDSTPEIDAGDFIFVEAGTANGKTGWVQTNVITTIGSDNIEFTQFSGAGTYSAGTGLTLTGTTFSINTGTTVDLSTAQTLSNKSIALGSNTVSGTLSQFNSAVTDADLASLAGAETLSNKTIALGSNTISGTLAEFNTALTDADFATIAGTQTLTNKTLTSPVINLGLNAQTGTTYTLALSDAGKVVTASNASAITVTIPPASSVAYATGSQITVIQKGAGQVTFAQGSGVTIRSTGATSSAPTLRVQYSSATCVYEGGDVWYIVGDIS